MTPALTPTPTLTLTLTLTPTLTPHTMTRYVAATITQTSYVTMCSVFLGLMEYVWLRVRARFRAR